MLQPSQLPLGCPDLLDLPHTLSCLDSSPDSAARQQIPSVSHGTHVCMAATDAFLSESETTFFEEP